MREIHAAAVLDRKQEEADLEFMIIVDGLRSKHANVNKFADEVRATFMETVNVIGSEAHEMAAKIQSLEHGFQGLTEKVEKDREPPQGERHGEAGGAQERIYIGRPVCQ